MSTATDSLLYRGEETHGAASPKWHVFVSHNSKQKSWVRRIVKHWRMTGLRVFFDEDSINPGEDVVSSIEHGLANSRFVVLVITPDSVASKWVAMETAVALYDDPSAASRHVIPVLLEETPTEDIRPSIRRLSYIDLSNDAVYKSNNRRLRAFASHFQLDLPPTTKSSSPTNRKTKGTKKSINLETEDSQISVTLVLNERFSDFTKEKQLKLVKALEQALGAADEITIKRVRRGSVVVDLEVSVATGRKLVRALAHGEEVVDALRITDIRFKHSDFLFGKFKGDELVVVRTCLEVLSHLAGEMNDLVASSRAWQLGTVASAVDMMLSISSHQGVRKFTQSLDSLLFAPERMPSPKDARRRARLLVQAVEGLSRYVDQLVRALTALRLSLNRNHRDNKLRAILDLVNRLNDELEFAADFIWREQAITVIHSRVTELKSKLESIAFEAAWWLDPPEEGQGSGSKLRVA